MVLSKQEKLLITYEALIYWLKKSDDLDERVDIQEVIEEVRDEIKEII